MPRYRATLTATFEVEAENAVQARLAAKRIRSLGEVVGRRLAGPSDRDSTRYAVRLMSERLTWKDPR